MGENSSTTCNERENSTKIGAAFTLLNSFARLSIFTASTLFIGDIIHLHHSQTLYANQVPSDLKPENILLDYTGHIALCDFGLSSCTSYMSLRSDLNLLGLCKLNMSETEKTNSSFCPLNDVHTLTLD